MVFTLFSSSTEYGIFFNFRDVLKHYFCIFSPLITISYTPSSLPSFHTCTHSHAHKATVMSVNWNQNGNWLLTASRDHLIKVYDIRAMKEMYTLKGHKKDVNSKGNGDASFDNQFFISKTVWSCSQTLFWVWNWTTWYISFPGFQYLIYSFQYTNMEGEGDIVMSGKHKHGGGRAWEILWCQVNTRFTHREETFVN